MRIADFSDILCTAAACFIAAGNFSGNRNFHGMRLFYINFKNRLYYNIITE